MHTTTSELACPPDQQCRECKMVCQSEHSAITYALHIAAQVAPQLREALQKEPQMGVLDPGLLDTLSRLEVAIASISTKPVTYPPGPPTPPRIMEAMHLIAGYLRGSGYEQVVIAKTGGASFSEHNIYDELHDLHSLVVQMESSKSPTLPQFL